jgi:hypothetical protein
VSLALAIVAVGLHLTALGQFSRGAQTIARAVTLSESERVAARQEASRCSGRGAVIGYTGLAFALASIGFVIASARRHEPAWRSLTFALLGFYVILQFVLV